ncbi:MAG: VWA domain-containing protein [Blastochloris sp.]|nr:VWA domain-containing protein [Blastochloris sp.]
MMRFHDPTLLWLLLVLPILALWWGGRGKSPSLRFPTLAVGKLVGHTTRNYVGLLSLSLRLLTVTLLILALARPQIGKSTAEVEASGIDIMLVIDASPSMQSLDFKLGLNQVDRLTVVKKVISEFIEERPNDRIGLVAFAGDPYLVSPLTLDHDWLLRRLEQIQPGDLGEATAIGSALAMGLSRLEEKKSKSRILILLTDGVNNAGSVTPSVAAEAARSLEIKVYTVGAGIQGEAPIPMRDPFGGIRYRMLPVEIDEVMLKDIAQKTGALYFRATTTESLKNIYSEINQLETTKRTLRKQEDYRELFAWLLGPALFLLGTELLLASTLLRRIP